MLARRASARQGQHSAGLPLGVPVALEVFLKLKPKERVH
jgi:hypothetical protein